MILPEPSAQTRPFWSAAAEHRLVLRYCPECDAWLHPQAPLCGCGRTKLGWREASGRGTLVAYTVVRHTPVPALQEHLPCTLLLVRLAEGPQLVSSLPGDGHTLRCGIAMRAIFDDIAEGVTLVRFRPAGAA